MSTPSRAGRFFSAERSAGVALFLGTFFIFWLSPVMQLTDSGYSLLLSQSLIEYRTFQLDSYLLPPSAPRERSFYIGFGSIYQLEIVDNHIYYLFPPGGPVLSVPYVAAARAIGARVTNADGTYNEAKEKKMQAGLAALLMAALAVIFLRMARLVLPLGWSVIISLGASFGTQVWSTASRAVWSDTWGILLLSVALFFLFAADLGRRTINPLLYGTLLSWMFFVRPTNAVNIAAILVYLFLFHRSVVLRCVITGAGWLALFLAYSWHYFHRLLPTYYGASRLYFHQFWTALAGNLVSPARGLLVYVPVLFFVAYLLARYRGCLRSRLMLLAAGALAVHLVLVSAVDHWWGGYSYGPRLTTGLVPWFVLLAILGVQGALKARTAQAADYPNLGFRIELACGALLLLVSIAINGRGAVSRDTWEWNVQPASVDYHPERLWDWRQPQFLAGLVRPPMPANVPELSAGRIEFATREAEPYLWYGWSAPDASTRWSDGREATLVFGLDRIDDIAVSIKLRPFLVPGKVNRQVVGVYLNGQEVKMFSLTEARDYELSFVLSKESLQRNNELMFKLPDAAIPAKLTDSPDQRRLGIAAQWIKFQPQPSNQ